RRSGRRGRAGRGRRAPPVPTTRSRWRGNPGGGRRVPRGRRTARRSAAGSRRSSRRAAGRQTRRGRRRGRAWWRSLLRGGAAEEVVRGVLPRPDRPDERARAVGRVAGAEQRTAVGRAVRLAEARENLRDGHLPRPDVVVGERERLRNRPAELRVHLRVLLAAGGDVVP